MVRALGPTTFRSSAPCNKLPSAEAIAPTRMALLLSCLRGGSGRLLLSQGAQWAQRSVLHTSSLLQEPAAPKPVALSKLKDSFNDATSGARAPAALCSALWQRALQTKPHSDSAPLRAVSYLEELEKRFHEDPASVDRSWAAFFTNMGARAAQRVVDGRTRARGAPPGRACTGAPIARWTPRLQIAACLARPSPRPTTPLRRARFRRRTPRPASPRRRSRSRCGSC